MSKYSDSTRKVKIGDDVKIRDEMGSEFDECTILDISGNKALVLDMGSNNTEWLPISCLEYIEHE